MADYSGNIGDMTNISQDLQEIINQLDILSNYNIGPVFDVLKNQARKGARAAGKDIADLKDILDDLSDKGVTNAKKSLYDFLKEIRKVTSNTKDAADALKSMGLSGDLINRSLESVEENLSGTAKGLRNVAQSGNVLDWSITKLVVGFEGLDHITEKVFKVAADYHMELYRGTRLANTYGKSFGEMQETFKNMAVAVGLNERSMSKMYQTFNRTLKDTVPTTKEMISLVRMLGDEYGKAEDEILNAAKVMSGLQSLQIGVDISFIEKLRAGLVSSAALMNKITQIKLLGGSQEDIELLLRMSAATAPTHLTKELKTMNDLFAHLKATVEDFISQNGDKLKELIKTLVSMTTMLLSVVSKLNAEAITFLIVASSMYKVSKMVGSGIGMRKASGAAILTGSMAGPTSSKGWQKFFGGLSKSGSGMSKMGLAAGGLGTQLAALTPIIATLGVGAIMSKLYIDKEINARKGMLDEYQKQISDLQKSGNEARANDIRKLFLNQNVKENYTTQGAGVGMMSGALSGAIIGTSFGVIGAIPGAIAGAVAGGTGGAVIGSMKGDEASAMVKRYEFLTKADIKVANLREESEKKFSDGLKGASAEVQNWAKTNIDQGQLLRDDISRIYTSFDSMIVLKESEMDRRKEMISSNAFSNKGEASGKSIFGKFMHKTGLRGVHMGVGNIIAKTVYGNEVGDAAQEATNEMKMVTIKEESIKRTEKELKIARTRMKILLAGGATEREILAVKKNESKIVEALAKQEGQLVRLMTGSASAAADRVAEIKKEKGTVGSLLNELKKVEEAYRNQGKLLGIVVEERTKLIELASGTLSFQDDAARAIEKQLEAQSKIVELADHQVKKVREISSLLKGGISIEEIELKLTADKASIDKQIAQKTSDGNEAIEKIRQKIAEQESSLAKTPKGGAEQKNAEESIRKQNKQIDGLTKSLANEIQVLEDKKTALIQIEELSGKGAVAMQEYLSEAQSKKYEEQIKLLGLVQQAQGKEFEGEKKRGAARISLMDSQISMVKSFFGGLGLSYEMVLNQVENIRNQQGTLSKQLINTQKNLQDASNLERALMSERDRVERSQGTSSQKYEDLNERAIIAQNERVKLEITAIEFQKERNELIQKELELTKEIRVGYLSAIDSQAMAAGNFEKILFTRDQHLGKMLEVQTDRMKAVNKLHPAIEGYGTFSSVLGGRLTERQAQQIQQFGVGGIRHTTSGLSNPEQFKRRAEIVSPGIGGAFSAIARNPSSYMVNSGIHPAAVGGAYGVTSALNQPRARDALEQNVMEGGSQILHDIKDQGNQLLEAGRKSGERQNSINQRLGDRASLKLGEHMTTYQDDRLDKTLSFQERIARATENMEYQIGAMMGNTQPLVVSSGDTRASKILAERDSLTIKRNSGGLLTLKDGPIPGRAPANKGADNLLAYKSGGFVINAKQTSKHKSLLNGIVGRASGGPIAVQSGEYFVGERHYRNNPAILGALSSINSGAMSGFSMGGSTISQTAAVLRSLAIESGKRTTISLAAGSAGAVAAAGLAPLLVALLTVPAAGAIWAKKIDRGDVTFGGRTAGRVQEKASQNYTGSAISSVTNPNWASQSISGTGVSKKQLARLISPYATKNTDAKRALRHLRTIDSQNFSDYSPAIKTLTLDTMISNAKAGKDVEKDVGRHIALSKFSKILERMGGTKGYSQMTPSSLKSFVNVQSESINNRISEYNSRISQISSHSPKLASRFLREKEKIFGEGGNLLRNPEKSSQSDLDRMENFLDLVMGNRIEQMKRINKKQDELMKRSPLHPTTDISGTARFIGKGKNSKKYVDSIMGADARYQHVFITDNYDPRTGKIKSRTVESPNHGSMTVSWGKKKKSTPKGIESTVDRANFLGHAASGGMIKNGKLVLRDGFIPGSTPSDGQDNLIANASNGYIINAKSAAKHRRLLNAITGMASGGKIGDKSSPFVIQSASSSPNINIGGINIQAGGFGNNTEGVISATTQAVEKELRTAIEKEQRRKIV